jgi:hypothetical protein
LWTAGTEQTFYWVPGLGHFPISKTFCSLVPGTPIGMGIQIGAGDEMWVGTWTGNQDNGLSPWSTFGGCHVSNFRSGQWAEREVSFDGMDFSNSGTHFFVSRVGPSSGGLFDLTLWLAPGEQYSDWKWLAVESSRWDGTQVSGAHFDINPTPPDVEHWAMNCPSSATLFCAVNAVQPDGSFSFIWNWWGS